MKPYKFNNELLELLLLKIKAECKVTFSAGGFNLNFTQSKQRHCRVSGTPLLQ